MPIHNWKPALQHTYPNAIRLFPGEPPPPIRQSPRISLEKDPVENERILVEVVELEAQAVCHRKGLTRSLLNLLNHRQREFGDCRNLCKRNVVRASPFSEIDEKKPCSIVGGVCSSCLLFICEQTCDRFKHPVDCSLLPRWQRDHRNGGALWCSLRSVGDQNEKAF